MGNYWLVALLVFPTTLIADWTATDRDILYSIQSHAIGIDTHLGDMLPDVKQISRYFVEEIVPDVADIDSNVYYINQSVDKSLATLVSISNLFASLMAKDFAVASSPPRDDNSIRVTSDGINSRLDLILGALTNRYFEPLYLSPYNSVAVAYDDGSYASVYNQFLNAFYDYFAYPTQPNLQGLLLTYSMSGTLPFFAGAMLDWDSILERSSDDPDIFNNLSQFFSIGGYTGDVFTYFPYLRSFGKEMNYEYGTSDLRINISNFLYSAVNNGVTNHAVLAQLLSRDGLNALIQNEAFSNALASVVQELSTKQGVNTNDLYVGSYGTNDVDLAGIVTNGVGEFDINSDYSAYQKSVSSSFFSNKVSKFDFRREFDQSIKPFIDQIESQSEDSWIIEFGNVTLDNFSYTIPAITIERNEIFLGFVDRSLNVLKAVLSFCYFLVLWRQLGRVAET